MASPCCGAASTGDAAARSAKAKTASRCFIGATCRIDHPLASSRAGSSDPDTLIPMPCLDRFFGIEIEYRVVGPDDGFNPPGFVFEHQMNARRRRRQLRLDRARERVDKLGPHRTIKPTRRPAPPAKPPFPPPQPPVRTFRNLPPPPKT